MTLRSPCEDGVCEDGKFCDKHFAEEMREHQYLRGISKYAAGYPIDEDYYSELRAAGRIA